MFRTLIAVTATGGLGYAGYKYWTGRNNAKVASVSGSGLGAGGLPIAPPASRSDKAPGVMVQKVGGIPSPIAPRQVNIRTPQAMAKQVALNAMAAGGRQLSSGLDRMGAVVGGAVASSPVAKAIGAAGATQTGQAANVKATQAVKAAQASVDVAIQQAQAFGNALDAHMASNVMHIPGISF